MSSGTKFAVGGVLGTLLALAVLLGTAAIAVMHEEETTAERMRREGYRYLRLA